MKGFFETLFDSAEHNMSYKIGITIKDDILTVSMVPKVEKGTSYELPPFEAKGTAKDLDAEFASAFWKALDDSKALLINVEAFKKGVEKLAEEKPKASEKSSTKKASVSKSDDTDEESKETVVEAPKKKAGKKKKLPKLIQDQINSVDKYKASNNIPFVTYTLDLVIKAIEKLGDNEDLDDYDVDLGALKADRASYDADTEITAEEAPKASTPVVEAPVVEASTAKVEKPIAESKKAVPSPVISEDDNEFF